MVAFLISKEAMRRDIEFQPILNNEATTLIAADKDAPLVFLTAILTQPSIVKLIDATTTAELLLLTLNDLTPINAYPSGTVIGSSAT